MKLPIEFLMFVTFVTACLIGNYVSAYTIIRQHRIPSLVQRDTRPFCYAGCCHRRRRFETRHVGVKAAVAAATSSHDVGMSVPSSESVWNGEVVSNPAPDGSIRGCSIQQVAGRITDWIVTINGMEADLGRFSAAIYNKIVKDAKQQRYQGFRPGTIPPQLEPTYLAFTMDECARETVLEALQQNNIRPFDSTRTEMYIEQISFSPSKENQKKKKKSGGSSRKKTAPSSLTIADGDKDSVTSVDKSHGSMASSISSSSSSSWCTFATMKEAIDGGWRPGTSFSFVATKVKGQKVKNSSEVQGARPLGRQGLS